MVEFRRNMIRKREFWKRAAARFIIPRWQILLLLLLLACLSLAWSQGPSTTVEPIPRDDAGQDIDPTKPVVWNIRNEYSNLRGDAWTDAIVLRTDKLILKNNRWGGRRGIILRFDLPIVVSGQGETTAGLGDLYAQFVYLPYLTRKFAFATGSGLYFPTATDQRLGTGKWTIAPVVAPVWFIQRKGFFLVKLQDYVSVAGDDRRRDLHYFSTNPVLVWKLKKPWWIQVDGEAKTNFENSGRTGFKLGFLLGRMFGQLGVWIKPEVPFGPYRDGDFALKSSVFWVK